MPDDRNPTLAGDAKAEFSYEAKGKGKVNILTSDDGVMLIKVEYPIKGGTSREVWDFFTIEELADALIDYVHNTLGVNETQ